MTREMPEHLTTPDQRWESYLAFCEARGIDHCSREFFEEFVDAIVDSWDATP